MLETGRAIQIPDRAKLANSAAAASARWADADCQPLGLTPFQIDAGEQTQTIYLHSWTATDSAGQSGKSWKFAGHSRARARMWPADEEKRPVSNGRHL